MKKLLTILLTLTLSASTLWAEQVEVDLYNANIQPVPQSHDLIIQAGDNVKAVNEWWDANGFISPFTSTSWGYITFTALEGTILKTYYFDVKSHFSSVAKPKYKINEGSEQSISSDAVKSNNDYNQSSLKISGKVASFINSKYYPRFKNFKFTVVIPEVVERSVTTTTTLTKLENSDLEVGTISRVGNVPFVVKDPIDQTNPQNYFTATIKSPTGETWTVLSSGWSCVANNEANRVLYNVENTTTGSYIVLVPVQYTATTKQKGTFTATVHLESKNAYNTNNDDQNAQITVGDVMQEYAISWGNSWENGGEVSLFKGDTYPRTGSGGYLANTAGLTLGIPVVEVLENPTATSTLVSFDANGAMTLHETGKVRLTYTQPGSTTHNAKTLTLTVNVIKRTPTFTLNSDEYVGGVHVFYVNHDYSSFVTSSNTDYTNYPLGITHLDGNNAQFISFDGISATTYAVPMENISITVTQEDGDLWNSATQSYVISIRENPIHVGTLCDRTPAELLQDPRCYVGGSMVAFEGDDILLGSTAGNTNGGWAIFKFVGTPDKLQWSYTTTDGSGTWTAEQSVDGTSFHALTNGDTFDEMAKYLRLSISGDKAKGRITTLCITEKVGAELTPNPIELYSIGGIVRNATFTANISNLVNLHLVLSSDEFELVRDGQVFDANINTLILDYKDGLGIDRYTSVPVQVAYVGDPATAVGKTCTVTAQDEAGNALATASIEVKEISSTGNVPNVIVEAIADATGIYTGTEHEGETHPKNGTFPYKTKWQVDVSSAFSNGQPLFDRLYILGLTTNKESATLTASGVKYHNITAPSASAPSTAVTPCYIYDKSGSGYTLVQTIDNMNPTSGTKPIGSTTANGQKYYYTGYCPYASNGFAGDKGVFYFSGGAGASVDVYLENLYMYARYHTESGATKILATDTLYLSLSLTGAAYVEASAAVFVFEPTSSTSFNPNIHLRGSNKMEGGTGALEASLAGKTAAAGMHSAPIHLLASSDDVAATLSIDDKWPVDNIGTTERTNGKLDLSPTYTGRPCIELGNDNSVLNINGGQLYLKNSVPTSSSYLCTFAIGQRSYTKSVSIVSATLKGLGTDQGGGSVNFNDGSIYCYELTDKQMETYGGYYRGKAALKCPANTKINGGTFYCDVWACSEAANLGASPTDRYGNPLASLQFPINNTPVEPYYLATVDFDNLAAHLICDDATHSDYGKSLAQYYVGKTQYGHSSLKASAENKVTFMLPYQFTGKGFEVEETVVNWVMSMSTLEAKATVNGISQNQQFGGPAEVVSGETEHTRFLLYGEIDSYTIAAAGDGSGYMTPEIDNLGTVEVTINENEYRNDITNTAAYQVDEAQFMVKPIYNADEWMLFCPPFDITNVYVVEAYPEEELKTIAETNMDEAYRLQATAAVDLFFYLGYDIGFNQTNSDFWTIYNKWKNNKELTTGAGRIKLTHFTGSNYSANYYLQRSSGIWEWDGSKFTTDWKYLPAIDAEGADEYYKVMHGEDEYEVVMKKGEIYSMKFPYMYSGYEEWDYWTGKYLIFEGKGPQIIEGKDYHNSTVLRAKEAGAGTAEIRGNSTLAAMNVSNMGAYYLFDGAQKFTRKQNDAQAEEHWPGEGFVLATPPTSSPAPRRIASIDLMTGDVTYEPVDGSENTVTGTPTIDGGHNMLVYVTDGGLGVVPVTPQYVYIYNTAGQLVVSQYLTDDTRFTLPTGIYLVRGEKEQAKAIVR
ncbi:MAG: hypothetical protein IKY87_02125 [Paludibacteraceae bacterium]|nr:hypothetical protein [Paludibacteraceae bacterium]